MNLNNKTFSIPSTKSLDGGKTNGKNFWTSVEKLEEILVMENFRHWLKKISYLPPSFFLNKVFETVRYTLVYVRINIALGSF